MPELLTIGETMVALVPDAVGRLRYSGALQMHTAGAESNVAIGVQKLGHKAAWLSKIGDDEMGHFILNQVRSEGVDCTGVVLDVAHRTGVMFKQRSGSETSVFYYRENSAASHLAPADLDEALFCGAKILHITGITPVLSQTCAQAIEHAISLAKKHGLLISFDPNIRKKLWGAADYTQQLRALTLAADIVLIGLDEAKLLFAVDSAEAAVATILAENPTAQIAVKNGKEGAVVANTDEQHSILPYACHCVEPIGAGDAFSAGFLAGVLAGEPLAVCGKMGAIAGALATEVSSDVEGQPDVQRMQAALLNLETMYR